MSAAYTVVVQFVDGHVLLNQSRQDQLDRDVVWTLIDKMKCPHALDLREDGYKQRVTITRDDETPGVDRSA